MFENCGGHEAAPAAAPAQILEGAMVGSDLELGDPHAQTRGAPKLQANLTMVGRVAFIYGQMEILLHRSGRVHTT